MSNPRPSSIHHMSPLQHRCRWKGRVDDATLPATSSLEEVPENPRLHVSSARNMVIERYLRMSVFSYPSTFRLLHVFAQSFEKTVAADELTATKKPNVELGF